MTKEYVSKVTRVWLRSFLINIPMEIIEELKIKEQQKVCPVG